MPRFDPNQRISDVLASVHDGRFRLPNIQRGYEWDCARVLKLLDSIMSGYPIGAIMVWQPPAQAAADIRTRQFIRDFVDTDDYLTEAPHAMDALEPYFVLDGQQRLQSLYLAIYGSYNTQRVFLQVDHSPSTDDEHYRFHFLTASEALDKPWLVPLGELVSLNYRTRGRFIDKTHESVSGPESPVDIDERRAVITENVDRFLNYFTQESILLFQVVPGEIDYDHVLEIFERVNSGGMVLSKSDLLFCTLKLQLSKAEEEFAEMLRFLNQGGRHQFTTDFLIKTCLVAFGKGAKYEVAKLKDPQFVSSIEDRMGEWTGCLRQLYAWLDETARIKCGRFLRSQSALIPIIDYMLASGNRDKPDGRNSRLMLEYLHMAFIKRLFSRSADNVLDRLHGIVERQVKTNPGRFPLEEIRGFMEERSGVPWALHEREFLADPDLMLNIVDGGRLQQDPNDPSRDPKDLKLEVDHIFPRSKLFELGLGDVADHIGNYRLIVMPANRRKRARMPDEETDFFGRQQPEVELRYIATVAKLSRSNYLAFRNARATLIRSEVCTYLGVPPL